MAPIAHGQPPFGASVKLDRPSYIDPTVRIFGDVEVGEGSNLWPYSVIRAEMHGVRIGKFCNVQDHAMIHVGGETPTVIGDYCSITHRVVVHGAEIGDHCLIGIGAVLMDRVKVGRNSIVAGGAFLTEGTVIPENSIVMGMPGKVVATRDNFRQTHRNALIYYENGLAYAQGQHDVWSDAEMIARVEAQVEKAVAMEDNEK
jgi:carbonic anhydrase/acetyltransferase-like protein (isoleucine patch superfamily)